MSLGQFARIVGDLDPEPLRVAQPDHRLHVAIGEFVRRRVMYFDAGPAQPRLQGRQGIGVGDFESIAAEVLARLAALGFLMRKR